MDSQEQLIKKLARKYYLLYGRNPCRATLKRWIKQANKPKKNKEKTQ